MSENAAMRKTVRCSMCRTEFTEQQLQGNPRCPVCADSTPQRIAYDVGVKMNWQDFAFLFDMAFMNARRLENPIYLQRINVLAGIVRPLRPIGALALTAAERKSEMETKQPKPGIILPN